MTTIDTIADRSTGTTIAGKAYFETSTNQFIVYNGSSWIELDSDGVGVVAVYENRWGASFDGSNDYLSVTQSSAINISGDITLSAWVKRTSTSSYNAIYTKREVGGSMNYQLTINNSNGQLGLGHSGGSWVYNTTTTLSTNTWYHVAVTVSSDTAQFYVNGVAKDSFTGISITATTQDLAIGSTIGYNYFGGNIDEAALWDCALSGPDIAKIYNGTAPNGKPTDLTKATSYDTDRTANLAGYWRMGDDSSDTATSGGSIATITDSSGNGNDAVQATANNQPTFSDLTGESIYA